MAKKSSVAKNEERRRLVTRYEERRKTLKAMARDKNATPEERFAAQLKMQSLPRNANPTRVRNRCNLSGRPRGYYRKFGLSRIAIRDLGSTGQLPGVVKSSW